MAPEVVLVADRVLPEPRLPHIALPAETARGPATLHSIRSPQKTPREARLDEPHACAEIRVPFWELPQAMEVIRQKNHGQGLERPIVARSLPDAAETFRGIALREDGTAAE
jgi:hypothetical protein